jgi:putative acetyltransferase
MSFQLRPITASDNTIVAEIIRTTLLEFGAAKPGTMYYDPNVYHTFEQFQKAGCAYFVVEMNDKIVGCGGVFKTEGLPEGVVELSRMYLLPEARGKGIGKHLLQHCENTAQTLGYQQIYLESMPELRLALPLYEKSGYEYLNAPLGDSGHFGCGVRMLKKIPTPSPTL